MDRIYFRRSGEGDGQESHARHSRRHCSYELQHEFYDCMVRGAYAHFMDSKFVVYIRRNVAFLAGLDMAKWKIAVFIPRKPHTYGLLFHGGAMFAFYSNLPFFVCWVFRWKDKKLTPTQAVQEQIPRVAAWNRKNGLPLTVVCDSGFATKQVLAICAEEHVCVVSSVGSSSSSGHQTEYQLITRGLLEGECRTFLSRGFLFQARMGDGRPTVIATNQFKPATEALKEPGQYSRKEAILLAASEEAWPRLSGGKSVKEYPSLYLRAKFLCGEDVAYPPGTAGDYTLITEKALGKLLQWQLVELWPQLPNKGKEMPKKVCELRKEIMKIVDGDIEDGEAVENPEAEVDKIIGSPVFQAPWVTEYCSQFNAEDRINRALYQNQDLSTHRDMQALVFHDLIWNGLWNCYVCFIEHMNKSPHLYQQKYALKLGPKSEAIHVQFPFVRFVLNWDLERHRKKLFAPAHRNAQSEPPTRVDVPRFMESINPPPPSKETMPPIGKSPEMLRTLRHHNERLSRQNSASLPENTMDIDTSSTSIAPMDIELTPTPVEGSNIDIPASPNNNVTPSKKRRNHVQDVPSTPYKKPKHHEISEGSRTSNRVRKLSHRARVRPEDFEFATM